MKLSLGKVVLIYFLEMVTSDRMLSSDPVDLLTFALTRENFRTRGNSECFVQLRLTSASSAINEDGERAVSGAALTF